MLLFGAVFVCALLCVGPAWLYRVFWSDLVSNKGMYVIVGGINTLGRGNFVYIQVWKTEFQAQLLNGFHESLRLIAHIRDSWVCWLLYGTSDVRISIASWNNIDKYVGSPYCRAEMYAGRVACCPLVSHVQYEPRALLRLKKMGRTPDRYIPLTARRGQRHN